MNIIYIHTHDSGRQIGPYGHGIQTPNLMKMAHEGVLFRQYFTCGPTCSPSRSALLSGMSPRSVGMLGLAHRGFEWLDYSRHLAGHLSRNGWETVLCGIQHEAPHSKINLLGYDKILYGECKERSEDRGIRMIAEDMANCTEACKYIRSKPPNSFFLSFGMICTHRPFPLDVSPLNPDNVLPPAKTPDNPETRCDMAGFLKMAMAADTCAGQILRAVDEAGISDETLVIFTTDHGIAFPLHKCTLYDSGIGISLIMRFPGGKFAGRVVDGLVSVLDIFPSICDIAGIPKPPWLEGFSIMPLLNRSSEKIRDEIFSEISYHAAYEPARSVRTERYKLIRHYDGEHPRVVLPNIDSGPTKSLLLENGLKDKKKDMLEFYDLLFDPEEKKNLAASTEYAEQLADLDSRLLSWMQKTNDPLLAGHVPEPKGAIVTDKCATDPEGDKSSDSQAEKLQKEKLKSN